MKDPGRILILGAGPTGLGAAYRLQELGLDDFLVLEGREIPGGLASSYVDEQGFTWDVGGHVQFSHYKYYDSVLDQALGTDWLYHERESWVWMRGRFIPYPFQNNIHRLDAEERLLAWKGLERASRLRSSPAPRNFQEWIYSTFGEGIAEIFLVPYNLKVWGYPLESISIGWMGERVAVPDLERIRQNLKENRDDVGWGPNSQFRFPLRGGTGAIWDGVAKLLPSQRLRFGCRVTEIDTSKKTIKLDSGERLSFDTLISSLPLDALCRSCTDLSSAASEAASSLVFSSCNILGIGLKGGKPETLAKKCWMYFPEANSPYYRVTVFSNYSPHNVPAGEGHWSLMTEVCESPSRPIDQSRLESWTLEALRSDGLISQDAEVISFWHRREERGYPTPFLGRDKVLDAIRPELEKRRIFSRGRFGAWKYEVSNQDHSFMQGVEAVNRVLDIGEEFTIDRPGYTNSGVFLK